MKNILAFPRFLLSEALMILITLVVCLAGFTKAEVNTKYNELSPSQQDRNYLTEEAPITNNFPNNFAHQGSEMREPQLRGKSFFNSKKYPASSLEGPIKRNLDYFGDSSESDSEKESDGYGYDDDEYYHFNFKRNDESDEKSESSKSDKESVKENKQKPLNVFSTNQNNEINQKNKNDEFQSIEMLNYKESHPIVSQEDPKNPFNYATKPFTGSANLPKAPSPNPVSSLSGLDFKKNPAISESAKERKEESRSVSSSDSKIIESQKGGKVGDEKKSEQLQDSKLKEDAGKKEKESALKDGKDSVAAKTLRENSKSSEVKEKTVTLADDAKLKENVEKFDSNKNKDSENTKLIKEDKDAAKINADIFNPNELSEISNGASFVGNDYKDSLDVLKSIRREGDQKNVEEFQENERDAAFNVYQKDGKESQDRLREKQMNELKNERAQSHEFFYEQPNLLKSIQGARKPLPNYDYQNQDSYYKRREQWRESQKMTPRFPPEFQFGTPTQQQQQQQFMKQEQLQPEHSSEAQMKHYLLTLPPSVLENTEYHKNFIKSLKKYKAQSENATSSSSNDSKFNVLSNPANLRDKAGKKKRKRSKSKKRNSLLQEKALEDEATFNGDKNRVRTQKRKAYGFDDSHSGSIQEYFKQLEDSQSLNKVQDNKEETNLLNSKKYFDQWNTNRQRRKSSPKLEYEIKIINQRHPEEKNVKFSPYASNRSKKNVKTKLGIEDKYLKKYPYSQVSRDELTKLSCGREFKSEKKFKRKASIWKRDDKNTVIRTRAVPSGYYSNRVKFGQKNYVKNNEKISLGPSSESMNKFSQIQFSQTPSEPNRNILQRAWEIKKPSYKHDPAKRFNENDILNAGNSRNSLLLVKKGQRIGKVFQEVSSPDRARENRLSSGQVSKLLPNDKNYIVSKKSDTDKLRKNEAEAPLANLNKPEGSPYANEQFPFLESPTFDNLQDNSWPTPLKSLHVRSFHSNKNDQKATSAFHSDTKSNFKKAIEKFRDMADFFKDTEQDTSSNRYSTTEVKDEPDIVFSQNPLPDPIVINNEEGTKENGLKQEPVNSIFAISNNFKNLDQQSRKDDFSYGHNTPKNLLMTDEKKDNENSDTKSSNIEGVVLDLNGNQLTVQRNFNPFKFMPKGQPTGLPSSMAAAGSSSTTSHSYMFQPAQYLKPKRQENVIGDIAYFPQPISYTMPDQSFDKQRMNLMSGDRAVAIIKSADSEVQIPESLHELAELPSLLKSIVVRVPLESATNMKFVNKKSLMDNSENEMHQNYNPYFQDFTKESEVKTKKETVSSPRKFLDQSLYYDSSLRNVGNVLQSLLTPISAASVNFKELNFDGLKNSLGNQKLDPQSQNLAGYQLNTNLKLQDRLPAEENNRNFVSFSRELFENDYRPSEEINNILSIEDDSINEQNNENKLRNKLEAASEKIYRLRREGTETGKLKKTIEDALSFKEEHESEQTKEMPGFNEENKNGNCMPDTLALKSDDKSSIAEDAENEKNFESQLRETEEVEAAKEDSESGKSSKSEYENHLSELFENLNKNQKNSNENTWNKKKRSDTSRRKRLSKRDVSKKVSKTKVQNTVVERLAEDNYGSVYSSGIKRRLLSTNNEMEDADSNRNALNHFNKVNAQDAQEKCEKRVDREIVKLFSAKGNDAEKNRARRSLTSAFHPNFKREIDLDESIPNDFHNFLVTSFVGCGTQKREVVKKGEALWDGKDMTQDNYNQIVEGGKDANEDSALKKREVPSDENGKIQNYRNLDYFSEENQEENSQFKTKDKSIRSNRAAMIKLKPDNEEKLPTQIRIQITNGSFKEKKSSKSIMDETETTPSEVKNPSKEKDFLDKNKANPFIFRHYMKFRQHPEASYSENEYEEGASKSSAIKQKPFYPVLRKERKKKKSAGESSVKPGQDFDQKAIESLMRDQESDQAGQKVSTITRLPQAETFGNRITEPTRAQREYSSFSMTNNMNEKLAYNKNDLQSNEGPLRDGEHLRPYIKTEDMRYSKGHAKQFENPDSKMYNGKMNVDVDPSGMNYPVTRTMPQGGEPIYYSNWSSRQLDPSQQSATARKWLQGPHSNYFYHAPLNVVNSQVLYDVMKFKQQMRNHEGTENHEVKPYTKQIYSAENEAQDNQQKAKGGFSTFPNWFEEVSDFSWSKASSNELSENKNYDGALAKTQNMKDFELFKKNYPNVGTFSKNPYEKSSALDATQSNPVDNSKDSDNIDVLEDEYPEIETHKEPQIDDIFHRGLRKQTAKVNEVPNYRRLYNYKKYKNYKNNYKNSELDDNLNDDEEEFDEEYEENGEDEDMEDYSQLGYKKEVEPEMTKLQNGFSRDRDNNYYNLYNSGLKNNDFEENKFNSKTNFAAPMGNVKNVAEHASGSNELLRKANEGANIFEKNLVKKLHENHDDSLSRLNKFQNDKSSDPYRVLRNKQSKRKSDPGDKSKQKYDNSQIGDRMFYAAKIEVSDSKDLTSKNLIPQYSKKRYSFYELPNSSPFNAEFASEGNDLDCEMKESGVRFNDNLENLADKDVSHNKNFENFTENDEKNVKEVEENLEERSEDNVLENVIGKYIMRKRISSPTNLNKASEEPMRINNGDKNLPESSSERKLKKRSTETKEFETEVPKISVKRLSSGHLTENNFRKYHKKNLNKKRQAIDLSIPHNLYAALIDDENTLKKRKTKDQMKRSALDLFRKITNKEKEKKVESTESRTAGFEPLLSVSDKSKGFLKEPKDAISVQEKQLSKDSPQIEIKTTPLELKAHSPNEGQRMRAQLNEKNKFKTKEPELDSLSANAKGPWKVELNDKYDHFDSKKGPTGFKDSEKELAGNPNVRYKAFLVISKNSDLSEQSPRGSHSFASKLFHGGIKRGYSPKPDDRLRFSSNHVRKRSLSETIASDHSGTEGDGKSLSEGDSKSHVQTSFNKNRRFASAPEENRNSQLFSKEKFFNRKSVFPQLSDANIIRDSRHVNEETSEYHSQRIVDAILSQVSENSQFKELIAPGLVTRTPAYREGLDTKNKATTDMKFSEELQSFLKKFMFDLENLAEQHVKKRMCSEIDKDLRQFLQSLLSIPEGIPKNDVRSVQPEKCSFSSQAETPGSKNLSEFSESQQRVVSDLRKNQRILGKIIQNYQNSSKAEKEKLYRNYPSFLDELGQAKKELKSSKNVSCLNSKSDCCDCNPDKTNPFLSDSGLNSGELRSSNETSNNYDNIVNDFGAGSNQLLKSPDSSASRKNLPVLLFNEVENPNVKIQTTTPLSVFENILPADQKNISISSTDAQKDLASKIQFEVFEEKGSTPETLYFLPTNSLKKQPNKDTNADQNKMTSSSGKRFLKRSDWEKVTDLGNATGESLEKLVAHPTIADVPSAPRSKMISSRPNRRIRTLQSNSDSPVDPKNAKTFTDFPEISKQNIKTQNAAYYPEKPQLIWNADKRISFPRLESFGSGHQDNCPKIRSDLVSLKTSSPLHAKYVLIKSNSFSRPCIQQRQHRQNTIFRRDIWVKKKVVPSSLTHQSKGPKEVP